MDKERLERAAQIFADTVGLGPDERDAFVIDACAGDTVLLDEIRSLLLGAEDADAYFDDLAGRLGVASSLEARDGNEPGTAAQERILVGRRGMVVGPYTLSDPVGSGGAGTVWRAERSDGQFEGQVAIKLLNPAAATSMAISRLSDEAQHLARLSHSNIARLLDAGVDDDDHPYLVLEYVDGMPIDRYCEASRLTVPERIRLFIPVLRAVAHAHAHLIVHRDIKPSNVLVDVNGNVKLLDFGIARLLRSESDALGGGSTVELGAALTPEYAAPEQILGQAVTTATDVYSLGLMLYQLLAGRSPRDTKSMGSFAELVESATQDPPKASVMVSSAAPRNRSRESLQRTLRGDLDNVLRKALSPEPADRYGSATDFVV